MKRMRATNIKGGTRVQRPSESSDSSSTHNFRAGGFECEKKRSVAAEARAFTPNYLLGVDLFNSKRTVEG